MSADNLLHQQYVERLPRLKEVANKLELYLADLLAGTPHIDRISARAKSPERFLEKALKVDEAGSIKYSDPINEIQDQIGARVTVFYLSDVEGVRSSVATYLRHIEVQNKTPANDSEFGYFGLHFIIGMPDDIIPDGSDSVPDFFELQIKTLFQHAWSEADHDLAYKSTRDLSSDEKRKVAFTAAQAWGADKIFEELAVSLGTNNNDNEPGVVAAD